MHGIDWLVSGNQPLFSVDDTDRSLFMQRMIPQ